MQAVEVYRQRVAQQNSVLLGKDDPIMILLTVFEQYEEDIKTLGEDERQRFLSLLELEQQKWTDESTRRAERIVARALDVVQAEAQATFNSAGDAWQTRLDSMIGGRLADIEAKERAVMYAALANIACTAMLALTVLFNTVFNTI